MTFQVQFRTVLLFYVVLNPCRSWIIDPGPQVVATKGEVWPKPQEEKKESKYYILSQTYFHFNIISEYCSIVQEAKLRYTDIILTDKKIAKKYGGNDTEEALKTDQFVGYMKSLDVSLTEPCTGDEIPELHMDENYTLVIPTTADDKPLLEAKSVWGILRGLETFSQSVYKYDDDGNLYVNATNITDYPRFPHRGLLMDTSRHYMPMDIIYKQLDAMAYNKMNVFHWHIVDDQSFPYQSTLFPELSNKGAYNQHLLYTPTDVQAVIEYARLRGIRLIPEFDTPGHTRSWGEGIPELLTACYKDGKPSGRYGPMDPSRPFVFSFLSDFLGELKSTFKDKLLHLGGDEVPFDCWWRKIQELGLRSEYLQDSGKHLQCIFGFPFLEPTAAGDCLALGFAEIQPDSKKVRDFADYLVDTYISEEALFPLQCMYVCRRDNPDINNFMASINISGDYQALQRYYMEKLFNLTDSKNITGIVWEEVYNAQTKMPKDAIVHVWYSGYYQLNRVTASGYRALYSSCWYLDHLSTGGDWTKYYTCDPENSGVNPEQLKLVLGGEACMWAEVVNNENVLQRTWPRASASAEKLWSSYNADNLDYAAKRLEEHACRLNRRKIPAQPPNGPGYCLI